MAGLLEMFGGGGVTDQDMMQRMLLSQLLMGAGGGMLSAPQGSTMGQAIGAGMQGAQRGLGQGVQNQYLLGHLAEQQRKAQREKALEQAYYGWEKPWTNPDTGEVTGGGLLSSVPANMRPLFASMPPGEGAKAILSMEAEGRKAPTTVEDFDDRGRPVRKQWDFTQKRWVQIGGAKADEPKSEPGKLFTDLMAGRISKADYDAAIAKATTDQSLVKVLQKDGSVIYVPRNQAVGQSAPDEATVVMGPDGKPIFMRGGVQSMKALQSGMTQASQNEIEKELIAATGARMKGLEIARKFRPEYQETPARLGQWWNAMKDRSGGMLGNLSPDEQGKLSAYSAYRAEAGNLFAQTLKDLSGAAVTPQEAERQKIWLPDPGTGVFDGDSPTQLKSKVDRFVDFQNKVVARLSYAQKHGLQFDKVPLDEMPKIIRERGNVLAAEFKQRGLDGDSLKQAVKQRLAQEFGLVME